MKKIWALIASLSLCTQAAEFYVSPAGNDSNAGTKEQPFRTLLQARNAVRTARTDSAEPSAVVLDGGAYRLSGTFELDERDSNTIYRAAPGQNVRITGGIEVLLNALKPVSDQQILALLPEEVRSQVVEWVVPDRAPDSSVKWPDRFRGYAGWPEIYCGGTPLRLARWPNTGYAQISKVLDRGSLPSENETPDRGGRFVFKENNPGTWSPDRPVYLGGYWCYKWYDEFLRVESIDFKKKQIQMAAPHKYGLGGPSNGLYFAINLPEELDQPGEYVYDSNRNTLYLLLPADAEEAVHVSIVNAPLVRINKAKSLSFRNIIFENGCDNGIEISDCESVLLSGCTVRQISGTGVHISGGSNCGLDRCHVNLIGKSAVSLNGGDRKTLTPSKHFATNCRISHFARLIKTYCPAVMLQGVGQIVSNNHLHDAPHCAILFGGNDHQIAFNHIESVCLDTSDAGAIYCGRDWTLGGNRIHGNFIHHLGSAIHHQNWGIYLDDMASGIEVSQNIVMDTSAGFLIGGGRSNVIKDNVIINCPLKSIVFDARAHATDWAAEHVKMPNGTLWTRLNEMPFKSGVWNKRFPYLADIEADAYKEPRRNQVTGNLLFGTPAMDLDPLVTKHGTVSGNLHSESRPGFQLQEGTLSTSDKSLKRYETMTIGPSK
jgi:hypothetical protein